jgi:tripartite-type tricarboxylate transporter receptor subunit TctC
MSKHKRRKTIAVEIREDIDVKLSALGLVACLAALACGAEPASAAFPERPLRIIVPFGAGGNADITARILADKLGERLGQRVIVENQPGPGGMAAARSTLQAPRDGYTMLWLHSGVPAGVTLIKAQAYDPLKDFTPIGGVSSFDHVIATSSESALKSFGDLVKEAKDQPGKLNGGTVVVGSTPHLTSEYLKTAARVDYQSVTFRTTPELIVSALRGDVHFLIDYYATMKSGLEEKKLRPLATTGLARSPFLRDVPTVDESGLKGYEVKAWNALYVAADTPKELTDTLGSNLRSVMTMPEIQKRLLELGIVADPLTPEAQTRRMSSEIEKWRMVIQQAKIPQQ